MQLYIINTFIYISICIITIIICHHFHPETKKREKNG